MSESILQEERETAPRQPALARSVDHGDDVDTRILPWLKVTLVSFIPAIVAFVLPVQYRLAAFVVAAGVMAAGLVMLIRHEAVERRGSGPNGL
jgi:hypothetical protein